MISRFSRAFIAISILLLLSGSIALLHTPTHSYIDPWTGELFGEGGVEKELHAIPAVHGEAVHGGVIMSKLGNATAKAELGRATWKLLHTMTLRFPEEPTQDQRNALESYIHLFSRLYPCGECAAEFQQLLRRFPPQTSSRRSAATWLCVVHNQVNERLGKPEFDCAHLDETYDCGCGDDPSGSPGSGENDPMDLERDLGKDEHTGVGMIKGGR